MSAAQDPEYGDEQLVADAYAHMSAYDRQALDLGPLPLARHLDRSVKARPHLHVISRALNDLKLGADDRVMVFLPPQVGKSFTGTWGAFHWLARYPSHRIITSSYGTTLAAIRGRTIRARINEYGHRFGLRMQRGSTAVTNWELTSGGGVRSAGVGAGITGMPADLALVDDPFQGRKQAESRKIRDGVWEWYSGDLMSRLAPGAPVIIVNTRWHTDDLCGRLLTSEGRVEDGGVWRVVFMPAIAMGYNPAEGVWADSLGRQPGEPLPHPKIPPGDTAAQLRFWEKRRASVDVRDWTSQYQCIPKDSRDALVTREVLREMRVRVAAPPTRTAVALDPSGGGRSTAGIIAGHLGADGKLYVTHDRTEVMAVDRWAEAVCLLTHEVDADLIIVERDYGGTMARTQLLSTWRLLKHEGRIPEHAPLPYVQEVRCRKNKRIRAEPVAHQMLLGNIHLLGMMPELEQEWATWLPTDDYSPGRVDTLTHLANGLLMPRVDDDQNSYLNPATINPGDVAGSAGYPDLPR